MTVGVIIAIVAMLASPLLCYVLSYLCSNIPILANFLSKLFWGLLGNIPIFNAGAQILENTMAYESPDAKIFGLAVLNMMLSSIVESFIIGFCIFVMKAIFAKFTRQGLLVITRGWISTVLGMALGILMTMTRGVLGGAFREIFTIILCLGLMLMGMGLMLGKNIRKHLTNLRSLSLGAMLIKILLDANLAWCCVALTVCSLEGPRIAMQSGKVGEWLKMYIVIVGVYYLLELVIYFISPSARDEAGKLPY